MKTDQLIDDLSAHMKPVKSFTPAALTVLWLAAATLVVLMVVAIGLGIRPDLQEIASSPHFVLMISSLLGTFISGAFFAFSGAIPGREISPWLAIAPFGFYLLFAFSVLPPFVSTGAINAAMPITGLRCTLALTALGIIPLVFLLALLRSLAVTNVHRIALAAGLTSMALGTLGISLYCTSRESLHLFTFHCLPILLLGYLTQALASRWLRW